MIWVIALVFLNLFDGFATLFMLAHGATELNPLMRSWLSIGAWVFILVKLLPPAAVAVAIRRYFWESRTARGGLKIAVVLYGLLALWSVGMLVIWAVRS